MCEQVPAAGAAVMLRPEYQAVLLAGRGVFHRLQVEPVVVHRLLVEHAVVCIHNAHEADRARRLDELAEDAVSDRRTQQLLVVQDSYQARVPPSFGPPYQELCALAAESDWLIVVDRTLIEERV